MIRTAFVVSLCALVLAGCNQGGGNYAPPPPRPMAAPVSTADERSAATGGLQQAQQLMAYSHAMWLVMDAAAVQPHFENARDRCLREAALNCILVSGSANAGDKNAAEAPAAELVVTLPHDQVAPFEKSLLGPGVTVRQQSVQAENITQQAVDIDRRTAQLTSYRDRLTAIAERPGVKADDLIPLEEKISELQGQLDELAAQKTTVGERAHRERVTISFTAETTVTESERPIARALDQSFEVLGESASAVILILVALLPWIPVGLGIWGIVWLVRRNARRRKAAKAAAASA